MRFFKYTDKKEPDIKAEETKVKARERRGFGSFWAKIVCIIAAFIVWFYVSGDQSTTYERVFSGVQISNVDMTALESRGFTVINGNVLTTVDVTVSGTRREVNSIRAEDINAKIDLSGIYSSGEHSVKVDVTAPGKTNVKRIYPSELQLYIGKSIKKSYDIEAVTHNVSMSDSSLKIKECRFSVNEVEVTGPEQELDKVRKAIVDLDFYGEKLSNTVVRSNVTIKLVDENGDEVTSPYITLSHRETNVEVVVNKYATVPVKPKYSDPAFKVKEAGYSENVDPETVAIRGTPEVVDGISYIETSPIDSAEVKNGYSTEVNLIIPQGAELDGVARKKAFVILRRENGTAQIKVGNILFMNVPEGFEATSDEKEITVSVSGNLEAVEKLNERNLYLVADLSSMTEAKTYNNVKLKVACNGYDILENGSVSVDGSYTCTVTLKRNDAAGGQ